MNQELHRATHKTARGFDSACPITIGRIASESFCKDRYRCELQPARMLARHRLIALDLIINRSKTNNGAQLRSNNWLLME